MNGVVFPPGGSNDREASAGVLASGMRPSDPPGSPGARTESASLRDHALKSTYSSRPEGAAERDHAPNRTTDTLPPEGQAARLRDRAAASWLYPMWATQVSDISPDAICHYVDEFMDVQENPTDRIERLIVEQVLLSHHAIGRLHSKAATAPTSEIASSYLHVAAKLTHEFGKLVAVLRDYRTPVLMRTEDDNANHTEQSSKRRRFRQRKACQGA